MLVLTRKLQQQIKIGDQITVTILRVKGQTVRVGIEAPRQVRVIRGELPPGSVAGLEASDETADETGVEETTFVITGELEDSNAFDRAAAVEPPSSPRLPQRKRFNRAGNPPLRVALGSASLAK
jgi:carbon storage regulator CsrA